jgi:protein-S-isoprenylcysteine O-methyltransferase Ste14
MAKNGFLRKHGIVRSAIRKDILYFALPAFIVFSLGLIFCARDAPLPGVWGTLWSLIKHPQNMFIFPVHSIIGLVLIIIGLIIMILGQATLWRNYSSTVVIREDHQLITHGIYRFTRNPIYMGAIIGVVIGLPVYSASLYSFLTMLFLIPILLNRIRLEEELLTQEFQDTFQRYKETTKKLIPFIY